MTLYQFNLLEEPEKMAMLAGTGNIIAAREEEGYFITLFQIEDFYAEIWQHKPTRDFYKVRSFLNTDQLEPYLEEIDISTIIKN